VIEICRYQCDDGSVPITEWLAGVRDAKVRAKLEIRFSRAAIGLFGDTRSVGGGILEMREDIGPGYRVYCARHGQILVILFCGGDKSTQCADRPGQEILAGMETEKFLNKMKRAASVSHSDSTIAELRANRAFAVEYLKAALEELDDSEHRAVGLLALRQIAEAYGGLAYVAQEAGITREALYRALSPKGNPTLKTLLAVLHAVGMRLSVAQGHAK
jgi:putative addiction module killer protein/probable addiction module antidote protein